MNPKDIQIKIDQFVEWEKPKREKHDSDLASAQKRLRQQLLKAGLDEEEIESALGELSDNNRVVVDGVNITIPKKIKSIKHEPKLCELGCGKIAVDQKIELAWQKWPEPHWRKKCNFCQFYQLPDGTFARNSQQLQAILAKKKRGLDK